VETGDAEVEELHLAASGDEDVRWGDVAVDDTVHMR
jgi:hypothetical protein